DHQQYLRNTKVKIVPGGVSLDGFFQQVERTLPLASFFVNISELRKCIDVIRFHIQHCLEVFLGLGPMSQVPMAASNSQEHDRVCWIANLAFVKQFQRCIKISDVE